MDKLKNILFFLLKKKIVRTTCQKISLFSPIFPIIQNFQITPNFLITPITPIFLITPNFQITLNFLIIPITPITKKAPKN